MKPVSEPALEDWRSTFTAEVTRGFLDAATRFARKRLRRLGLPCSADDARDLVLDVLHDTWAGVIVWKPECVSLRKHVRDAIRSRSRHRYRHGLKFRHVSADATTNGNTGEDDERVEPALSIEAFLEKLELKELASKTLEAVRALAADDLETSRLLDAYEEEATRGREARAHMGCSSSTTRAAQKRLDRLLLGLPVELGRRRTKRPDRRRRRCNQV